MQLEDTEEEHEDKRGEEREKGEDDQRSGAEEEELFVSCPSRPQYFRSQDRGRDRKNLQVIMSRCINIRIPTRPDRPHEEAEDDGEDGLTTLEHALKGPFVWQALLATTSSIAKVFKSDEWLKEKCNNPN